MVLIILILVFLNCTRYNGSVVFNFNIFRSMHKELELYEILLLLDPNLIDNEVNNKIEFYQEFLMGKGSKVMVQNQGRKGLSYAIKKFEAANFIQIVFLGNGQLINLLNSTIRRDERVLRHIVTKLNKTF